MVPVVPVARVVRVASAASVHLEVIPVLVQSICSVLKAVLQEGKAVKVVVELVSLY